MKGYVLVEKIDYYISDEQLAMMKDDYQPMAFSQENIVESPYISPNQDTLSELNISEFISTQHFDEESLGKLSSYIDEQVSKTVEQTLYEHKATIQEEDLHHGHIINILENVTDDALHILTDEDVDII